MRYPDVLLVACAFSFALKLTAQEPPNAPEVAGPGDEPTFTVQMVTVAEGVDLEVFDWGGTGRPLVLLAGLGSSAHTFDEFALKLTPYHRVYGITRRGFGKSTLAESGYTTDELGDDVVAVIDFLQLDQPVLVGHSFGGAELSAVATNHPEKVSGLVYLDAAYGYAFYDEAHGDICWMHWRYREHWTGFFLEWDREIPRP